ncbi:MAG: hypothetical protein WBF06_09995 [Candidatus Acidiferrales bacterium]
MHGHYLHGHFRGTIIVISDRRPLHWYRGVRRARFITRGIEIAAFIGAAALLSFLVLQPRW